MAALAVQVESFHGPAVEAAMPAIRDLRDRADADRPYLSAVQAVLAQWSDADDAYEAAMTATTQARDYLAALTAAPDTTPEDLAAARAHYQWTQTKVPDTAPATQFWDELTAAKTAREHAAGGAGNIVTHADADAALAAANNADRRQLQEARSELRRLRHDLTRAEKIAARSFAAAQLTDAGHIVDQMDAIGTELRVLTAAGDLITQPRLTLPERATALAPMTAHALARLASTPLRSPSCTPQREPRSSTPWQCCTRPPPPRTAPSCGATPPRPPPTTPPAPPTTGPPWLKPSTTYRPDGAPHPAPCWSSTTPPTRHPR